MEQFRGAQQLRRVLEKHAVAYGLKEAKVPNLNVAGWWDQEDFYGPMFTYENLEKSDQKNLNYLVVGPWNHGGWGHGPGNTLGEIPFGSDTAVFFRQQVEAPWFAYWLKDKGTLPLKEASTFPDRQQHLDPFRFVAAQGGKTAESLFP